MNRPKPDAPRPPFDDQDGRGGSLIGHGHEETGGSDVGRPEPTPGAPEHAPQALEDEDFGPEGQAEEGPDLDAAAVLQNPAGVGLFRREPENG